MSGRELEANQRQLLEQLRALEVTNCTVLEIGCGTAPLHAPLFDAGARSIAGIERRAFVAA